MKKVHCVKLNKELEALDFAPYPGELGEKIVNNISKEAWQNWLEYQTMLINEKNLNLMSQEAQQYLKTQAENYFFGGIVDKIEGYKPENSS